MIRISVEPMGIFIHSIKDDRWWVLWNHTSRWVYYPKGIAGAGVSYTPTKTLQRMVKRLYDLNEELVG